MPKVEAEAGGELSDSGAGGNAPRSRTTSLDAATTLTAEGCLALASAAPNANDKPVTQAMTLMESNWPWTPVAVYKTNNFQRLENLLRQSDD
jgi:hypothetical protein